MKPQIEFYNSCQIGRSDHKEGSGVTWPAYAVPHHYGRSKYSCVAISARENNREVVWYARLQALCRLTFEDESGKSIFTCVIHCIIPFLWQLFFF